MRLKLNYKLQKLTFNYKILVYFSQVNILFINRQKKARKIWPTDLVHEKTFQLSNKSLSLLIQVFKHLLLSLTACFLRFENFLVCYNLKFNFHFQISTTSSSVKGTHTSQHHTVCSTPSLPTHSNFCFNQVSSKRLIS